MCFFFSIAYEKGLEVEPTSALLKKGLDEVKKAQEKDGLSSLFLHFPNDR